MGTVEIVDFSDDLKDYFRELNVEWLEKYFAVLQSDEFILTNPVESIIGKGGCIHFAKMDNEIVGTFALIKIDEYTYELAKMAVTEKYQSLGIGKRLMEYAIKKAKDMGINRLILYSNTDLKIALSMYAKFGFRIVPKTDFHNERANIKMEMRLNNELFI
jgi:N-acetylglutamate synthase-like GNAT family acetyltransferase